MKRILLMSCIVVFISSFNIWDDFVVKLKEKMATYQRIQPQEKVYVHTDRPIYKPGETLWLKAYLVDGLSHQPTTLSEIVYIVLIDPKGQPVVEKKAIVTEGTAAGNIILSSNLLGGIYKLRVYTRYQRNLGEDTFFEKDIIVQKVVNPQLLLQLDFTQKSYRAGDEVVAKIAVKDLENEPITQKENLYRLTINGEAFRDQLFTTDDKGKATVRFYLPDTLTTTDVVLNAIVRANGVRESIARTVPITLDNIHINFYPEGGQAVTGLENRIAFKAVNEWGKPAEVVGVVLDKNNNTVVKFKSFYAGMGAFNFTPQPDERYTVKLEGVTTNQSFSLPIFERKGWLLKTINTEKDWLQVQIQTTHQVDQALLVAQVRGKIYHHQEVQLSEGKATCKVPTAQLPAGVVQLTLFDKAHLPQCERLAFVNPHKTLNIALTTDKKSYHPREQVTLKVQTTNENGRPVPANLSLSVANDKLLKLADDKQDHLLSYLLLSSEVKGEIHEPTFYFKQDEPRAAKALDYLLMTQGWRRFTWQKLLAEAPSPMHLPEKVGNLNGQLLDHQEKPIKGKVWLFELENAKRAIAVETTPQGEFTFVGVDPTAPLQLVATNRKGKAIDGKMIIKGWNQPEEKIALTPIGEALSPIPTTLSVQTPRQSRARQYTRSVLKTQAMSEVVVTAQSTVLQGQTAGVYITRQEEDLVAASNLQEILDGSTVGINTNGSTGENSAITIRGTSTLSTQAPLMIIDGMPMEGNLGDFSPDDVDNIAVLKGAAATALYGTRAANGAIVITTKRSVIFGSEDPYRYMQRLITQFVAAREFAKVPTFEAPDYANDPSPKQRTDFRSTIFWQGNITTDAQGEATVQFYNSDEETTFQMIAEGISRQGLVGRTTHFYAVQRPFSLTPTLPPFLSYGDVIDIPILIRNNTEKNIKGTLSLQVPSAFKALKLPDEALTISARTSQMYYARYEVLYQAAGEASIKIGFKGKSWKFSDVYVHPIEILPKGFPVSLAYHTNRHKAAIKANIRSLVPNSLKAYFVVYPSALGDLVASVKGIFRAPHGCFEQTSSATYPNVMALLLLEQLKETDVALKQQALQYIKQGYKRLTSFETKENGFEWFGHTPPHLGLTAYGLLEFTDMKKVYPAVSEPMLKRTKQWLLDQRDGNGGFKTTYQKYSWGTQATNNAAYALYALSEAGVGVHTIEKEFEQSWSEALASRSAYRLALMANVAYNLGQTTKGGKALQLLEELIQFYGEDKLPDAGYTVVGSRGDDYRLQVYALMGLALLKQETPTLALLNPINTFLLKHKKLGRYGSTQSTVLCLKFITAFQHITKSEFPDGTFQVALDQKAIPASYQAKALKAIEQPLADYLLEGKQLIQVTANNTEVPNWGVNIQYHTFEPQSNEHCEIDLTTKLYQANTQVGEIVRLAVKVKNKEKADQPMSVAVVGIPAGLSFQPWQLKEFKEKEVADYIEIFDNYLVFYFTGLKAEEEKHILLDLKANIPGTYTAPASSAYLYYNDGEKTWRAGTKITIVAPTK